MAVYWDSTRTDSNYTISGETNSAVLTCDTVVTDSAGVSAIVNDTGKLYFEIVPSTTSELDTVLGLALSTFASGKTPGWDASGLSWGVYDQGGYLRAYNSGSLGLYEAGSLSNGDIMGIAVDFSTGEIWCSKNGTWLFGGDPVNGTTPTWTSSALATSGASPAANLMSIGNNAQLVLESAGITNLPTGFTAWGDPVPSDIKIHSDIGLSTSVVANNITIIPIAIDATLGLIASVSLSSEYYSNITLSSGLRLSTRTTGLTTNVADIGSALRLASSVLLDAGANGRILSGLNLGTDVTIGTLDGMTVISGLALEGYVTIASEYPITISSGLGLFAQVIIDGDCSKSLPTFSNGGRWC